MAYDSSEVKLEGFQWSKSTTLLLISLIRENYIQLQTGVKKIAFQRIAKEINAKTGTNLSFEQIDTKWKGLKRTYKKIKESNSDTGRARKIWEFYSEVDELLHEAPEFNPHVAVSSKEMYDIGCEGEDDSENKLEGCKWSKTTTLLLLSLIRENYSEIQTGVKKIAFQRIAKEINATTGTNMSYEQIDTKWKGLKRTYKKIKESSSCIEQSRKSWEFYSEVDELLHQAPEMNSTDTVSFEEICVTGCGADIDLSDEPTCSAFSQNRKRRRSGREDIEAAKERRHQERMEVSNKFLSLFEKMIDKM